MADHYIDLPVEGSGGGGAAGVNSINSLQGDLFLVAGNGIAVSNFGSNITVSLDTFAANTMAGFNASGELEAIPNFNIDVNSNGMLIQVPEDPAGTPGYVNIHSFSSDINPTQNSPGATYALQHLSMNIDTGNAGFSLGTGGQAAKLLTMDFNLNGSSDVGGLNFLSLNSAIGNGTDAFTLGGLGFGFGFSSIAANVTVDGQFQGWGFQPNVNSSAISTSNFNVTGFYDNANIGVETHGYVSFRANPTVASISNNSGYNGLEVNPNITSMLGNSNFNGIAISSNVGTINQGGWNGININPTVSLNKAYSVGLNVNMDNVTNYAGVQSSVVIQDLTYTFNNFGDNNSYQIEYVDTATAGNESFSIAGQLITASIESGVSTATQVRAAALANVTLSSAITVVISGTSSNAQVSVAPTNFTSGVNPGTKQAANFKGDVAIDGALSFTGGLSIGALNSFATQDLALYTSGVNSLDTLITAPSLAASASASGFDLLGINTAMLLTLGDNSSVTTNFLGLAALGLPAVVNMGTGSTVDRVAGAVFAISMDAGSTGGTIDEVDLCRSIAIPNGVTTVTKLRGYLFDLPFGDPGTTTWGFYDNTTSHNYMGGDLLVGGTPDVVDTVANDSVAIEINSTAKAFLNARMTTTQRDALTAINGMQIYNTTTDKLQVYAAGAWVDLH